MAACRTTGPPRVAGGRANPLHCENMTNLLRTVFSRPKDHPVSTLPPAVVLVALIASAAVRAEAPPVEQEPVVAGLEAVEADVARCGTAADAVLVYRLFLADDSLSAAVREAAEKRVSELKALAAEGKARVGASWMTAAEAARASRDADDEVDHALELLRVGNGRLARESLEKAAQMDPRNGRARFAAGLVYARLNDPAKARGPFADVVGVDPANGPAFNNLAVCEMLLKRPAQAVEHFRLAADRLLDLQPLTDNVVLAIRLATTPRGKMSDKHLGSFNDLLRWLGREQGLTATESTTSYTLLSLDGRPCRDQTATLGEYLPRERARSACGFVIAEGRVLVPAGIVRSGWNLAVAVPGTMRETLPAEVVAVQALPGVALLRCENLKAVPLPLSGAVAAIGTEVMAVSAVLPGAPSGWDVGRGPITKDPELGLFMHGAKAARGLGGGPIVDARGCVVGMVPETPLTESIGMAHGFGIPIDDLWPLLSEHVPALTAAEEGEQAGGRDVEAAVRKSTVAVLQVKPEPQP